LPQILQAAVCPERRRGFYGALSALASVTEVQISNDLQVAKVYLSIYRWGEVLLWCRVRRVLWVAFSAVVGAGDEVLGTAWLHTPRRWPGACFGSGH